VSQGIGSLALGHTVHDGAMAPAWTVFARRIIKKVGRALFIRYRYYMLVPIPVLEREVIELARTTFSHR
jgi:hypothetical protein